MKEEKIRSPLAEVLEEFQQVETRLQVLPDASKAIMLFGENKAGKTAFFHYLQGHPLVHEKNQMGVYVLRPEDPDDPAKVGSDYTFTTLAPNFSYKQPQTTMTIDMPGYSNIKPKYQLPKIFVFYKAIEHIEEVHICQLLSEEQFQPVHLLKEAQKMSKFFQPQVFESEGCLSFVITKVEDDDAIANFEAVIEELKEQNEAVHVRSQLQHILLKNKYIFKNQQPNPDDGLQLSQTIYNESRFLKVSRQPKSLLSDSFYSVVLAQNDIGELLSFIEDIIPQLTNQTSTLVQLLIKSLKYQYSSIFSYLLEIQEQQLQQRLIEDIQKMKQSMGIERIKFIPFQKQEQSSLDKQNYQKLPIIFTRNQSLLKSHQLTDCLITFNKILELGIGGNHTWAKLSQEWIACLKQTVNALLSLLFTLHLIQVEEVIAMVDELQQNRACLQQMEEFYVFWQQSRQKLNCHPEYVKAIGDEASKTNSLVVVKQPCFKQIKNRQISNLFRKAKFTKMNQTVSSTQIVQDPTLNQQSIKALSNDSISFRFLIQQLPKLKHPDLQTCILQKIATIFRRFSLFEEAIVFMMALNSWQQIQCLVQEGFLYKEISPQFVFEVLFKYYCHFGPKESSKKQLQLCSNYISSLDSPQLLIRFQKARLRQIDALKLNIASSFQTHEKYQTIQLYYIHPIVQQSNYYSELLRSKETLFLSSMCYALLKDSIGSSLFS